jgi:hypothetical protein
MGTSSVYILLFSVWYSLASSSDGVWRYNQTFHGLESKQACEDQAKFERAALDPYTLDWKIGFKGLEQRKMSIVDFKHWCVTREEIEEMQNGTD